jgi:hypothetical protein
LRFVHLLQDCCYPPLNYYELQQWIDARQCRKAGNDTPDTRRPQHTSMSFR